MSIALCIFKQAFCEIHATDNLNLETEPVIYPIYRNTGIEIYSYERWKLSFVSTAGHGDSIDETDGINTKVSHCILFMGRESSRNRYEVIFRQIRVETNISRILGSHLTSCVCAISQVLLTVRIIGISKWPSYKVRIGQVLLYLETS